jgi:hypothetical protein
LGSRVAAPGGTKRVPVGRSAALFSTHATRFQSSRTSASSCTRRHPSGHRSTASGRDTGPDRSGGGCRSHRHRPPARSNDGNNAEPGGRTVNRLRRPQYPAAKDGNAAVVRTRPGVQRSRPARPHPPVHVFAGRILSGALERNHGFEPRSRHSNGRYLPARPGSDSALGGRYSRPAVHLGSDQYFPPQCPCCCLSGLRVKSEPER